MSEVANDDCSTAESIWFLNGTCPSLYHGMVIVWPLRKVKRDFGQLQSGRVILTSLLGGT
jgi:hypothetical protein